MPTGFPVKKLSDSRAMLNLACGTRMHWGWNNLDFSPYARLARNPALTSCLRRIGFISSQRSERLSQVDPEIISWDLRKGIPFTPATFDVVYHSHFLEHLEREAGRRLLLECHRVLRPGGIIRVVVPDLQFLASNYVQSASSMQASSNGHIDQHRKNVEALFDQMVRSEATGAREQKAIVRSIERLVRGGAAETGELHRWMYDQYTLGDMLAKIGFKNIQRHTATSSSIEKWAEFGLDNNPDGSAYKPESLYMEGVK